jgi:hypothetical protein
MTNVIIYKRMDHAQNAIRQTVNTSVIKRSVNPTIRPAMSVVVSSAEHKSALKRQRKLAEMAIRKRGM